MNLLIISNMAHYRREGRFVGWGPTVLEISELGTLFDEVRHVACLFPGEAPASALPYARDNIQLVPVRPTGGPHLSDKLGILARFPDYARIILRELGGADVVHVRCPANISALALVLLWAIRRPAARWVKYAGNWAGSTSGSFTYAFQRWWLRKDLARAAVTINGHFEDQPAHIVSFLNPCLDEEELCEGADLSARKNLVAPVRLTFVGAVDEFKGPHRAVEILGCLKAGGIDCSLDIVGDGGARELVRETAGRLSVDDSTRLLGWVPRPSLGRVLAKSHFVVLPSESEGWPKVLSEGMAYGAVPLAGAVGSVPQHLGEFAVGRAIDPLDIDGFTAAIREYVDNPTTWKRESERCVLAAREFSYDRYKDRVTELLGLDS